MSMDPNRNSTSIDLGNCNKLCSPCEFPNLGNFKMITFRLTFCKILSLFSAEFDQCLNLSPPLLFPPPTLSPCSEVWGSEEAPQECGRASACSSLSACSMGAVRRVTGVGLAVNCLQPGRLGRWIQWRRRWAVWQWWPFLRPADCSAWCRLPGGFHVLEKSSLTFCYVLMSILDNFKKKYIF